MVWCELVVSSCVGTQNAVSGPAFEVLDRRLCVEFVGRGVGRTAVGLDLLICRLGEALLICLNSPKRIKVEVAGFPELEFRRALGLRAEEA